MRLAAPLAFALALASSVEAGVLDQIRETGTVRFGYRADAAPLSYLGEGKKPAGYSVLVCGAVAQLAPAIYLAGNLQDDTVSTHFHDLVAEPLVVRGDL